MSETPSAPKGKLNLKGKVFGIPVLYLVGGFVVILAIVAWKMKPSPAVAASDAAAADSAATDAANPSGSSALPPMPVGTVVAAPAQPPVADAPYEDNSTWMRKAVAYLIAHGANPGVAQLAMQHYLAGNNLSFDEGALRDTAVRQFGLPPDGFDAGTTLPKPSTPAPPLPVSTTPRPVPRPSAPPPSHAVVPVKTYIVRQGDTVSGIAARFHYPGGWPALYQRNKSVIGPNPNLIRPGERLIVG